MLLLLEWSTAPSTLDTLFVTSDDDNEDEERREELCVSVCFMLVHFESAS
jgi:hypothetical protein